LLARVGRFALIFCLLSGVARAGDVDAIVAHAAREGLATAREWLVLGHYRERTFGGWRSEVDAPHFFLAAAGKDDPQAELEATIRAFFAPPVDPEAEQQSLQAQHPQCRFPARFRWIVERLRAEIPARPCPRFEEWRAGLRAQSATLIFASAYLNNPASMFGHTLLRLDRAGQASGGDLLAYAINFAANPTTDFPLVYMIAGLTGGFEGVFSTLPYYLKVKEYGDFENRDLWEFPLSFTRAEVDRMVAHLWEVGAGWLDYFYFDENCSYQLLALLEVGRPSLRLLPLDKPWVVPADTLRAVLDAPGLVSERRFRPSRHTLMLARRGLLDGDEAGLVADLAREGGDGAFASLAGLPPARRALVIDTAVDLLRYEGGQAEDPTRRARERRLLLVRRGVAVPPVEPEFPGARDPASGHGTAMLAAGAGADRQGPYLEMGWRGVLHDLAGPQQGYAPNTQIELMSGAIRVDDQGPAPALERLDLVRIASIAPYDAWASKLSWRLSTGFDRLHEGGCRGIDCLTYQGTGGPGVAVEGGPLVVYAFADLDLRLAAVFRDTFRAGAGASAGTLWQATSFWRWSLEGGYLYPFFGVAPPAASPLAEDGAPWRLEATWSFALSPSHELRVPARLVRGHAEAGLLLLSYF
jgi:hypothetical protein